MQPLVPPAPLQPQPILPPFILGPIRQPPILQNQLPIRPLSPPHQLQIRPPSPGLHIGELVVDVPLRRRGRGRGRHFQIGRPYHIGKKKKMF
jgi:hypothetical protein